MSRALRRHPPSKQKARAKSQGRPMPRTAPRPSPRREGRPGGGLLSSRPRFLMDIINELRKVVWPSREDTTYLTIVVVIVAVIVGAALGAIDIGFGWLIDNTLLR